MDTENKRMVVRGEEAGGWVKTVKGFRSTNRYFENSHRDETYSIRNMANNTVINYVWYPVGT